MIKTFTMSISVVIPIFNAGATIARCVSGILSQTFKEFELILVDDGSTDNSGAICDEYASNDKRIKVIHKSNGGVSTARNAGIEYANSEWISFIDADDIVSQNFLLDFSTTINEGCDLCIQGYKIIQTNGVLKEEVHYENRQTNNIHALDILCDTFLPGTIWNKCFKKALIEKHHLRFEERYRFREDEDFFLRYLQISNSVAFNSACNYTYFEPKWTSKYLVDTFDVNQQCFTIVNQISQTLPDKVMKRYINPYVNTAIFSFYISRDAGKRYKEMRRDINSHKHLAKNKTARISFRLTPDIAIIFLHLCTFFKKVYGKLSFHDQLSRTT